MTSPYETGRAAEVTGLDDVASADDAAEIVAQMLSDLRAHPAAWENPTLERFLDALEASLNAAARTGAADPTWRTLSKILVQASGYE